MVPGDAKLPTRDFLVERLTDADLSVLSYWLETKVAKGAGGVKVIFTVCDPDNPEDEGNVQAGSFIILCRMLHLSVREE